MYAPPPPPRDFSPPEPEVPIWSIPDIDDLLGAGTHSEPATAAHEAASALIAEALRQAEAEAEAQARAQAGTSALFDENRVDDGWWNLGAETSAPAWHFVLGDGSLVNFGRWALVGREATADDRWPDAELVSIDDHTASMSKTHIRLETDERGLVVVDLFSLNGTSVTTDEGELIDLRDGNRTRLTMGAQIVLGDFVARLERV
ncbi:MAG: FHA domain-containing protein [Microbacteriaceae bacterium]